MLLEAINSLVVEVVDLLFIEVNPRVIGHPHTTEFDYRSKTSPLQLVDDMVHLVRALDEVGLVSLDSQLHFDHDSLPVHDVNKNVLGDVVESVPHSHYFEDARMFFTYIRQTLVSLDDLFFLGMALAPE